MEILVLDGKNYVKASKAAKDLGYATDYVGQLCRSGQVDAHLIGRTWYVNQSELSTHKVEKKRMSREKAREYAKKSIEEVREKNAKTRNHYENIAIQYDEDNEPLIPETRKIEIESIPVRKGREAIAIETGDERTILNKGEKVRMSGDIPVFDVTDGEPDTETTFLEPKMLKSSPRTIKKIDIKKAVEVNTEETQEVKKINFLDRIQNTNKNEEINVQQQESPENTLDEIDGINAADVKVPLIGYVLFVSLIVVLGTVSIFTSRLFNYTNSNNGEETLVTSFKFSYDDTIRIISSKI